jgi:hypothetical protein
MPCFKGIAVSIHANSAPLPEYGIQKQSRLSRISTYIPVPQPTLAPGNKPEPAKFAISITLLTPGLPIPYSAPKPSESNPYPKPQFVGGLHPGSQNERGRVAGAVAPYMPLTNSENETIAAYIYFDGRAKEEVATLLRPGEETWVNSRWVQVPDSEGGGLAEREFLFREVGLERWLNGLDLKGHDAAEKLEKRRQKFERRRRRQAATLQGNASTNPDGRKSTLRYGDEASPIEPVYDDSDSWSDDDDEPPEATGQIKVAMFRVLASGEIKKGEYSPQFDAHDGDDEYENGNGIDADVEHTTSFAKPKTLDPKTISTQTVTGIDGPDKPYATFTFFYRGESKFYFFFSFFFSFSFSYLWLSSWFTLVFALYIFAFTPTNTGRRTTAKDWRPPVEQEQLPGDCSRCQTAIRPDRLLQPRAPEGRRHSWILCLPRPRSRRSTTEKGQEEEQRQRRRRQR